MLTLSRFKRPDTASATGIFRPICSAQYRAIAVIIPGAGVTPSGVKQRTITQRPCGPEEALYGVCGRRWARPASFRQCVPIQCWHDLRVSTCIGLHPNKETWMLSVPYVCVWLEDKRCIAKHCTRPNKNKLKLFLVGSCPVEKNGRFPGSLKGGGGNLSATVINHGSRFCKIYLYIQTGHKIALFVLSRLILFCFWLVLLNSSSILHARLDH